MPEQEHKVTVTTYRMSGYSRAAYYAAPTWLVSCTCGWRRDTAVERHVAVLKGQHEAGMTEPTGWRIVSTTYGVEVTQE